MFPHTMRRQKAPQRRRIMFVVALKYVFSRCLKAFSDKLSSRGALFHTAGLRKVEIRYSNRLNSQIFSATSFYSLITVRHRFATANSVNRNVNSLCVCRSAVVGYQTTPK